MINKLFNLKIWTSFKFPCFSCFFFFNYSFLFLQHLEKNVQFHSIFNSWNKRRKIWFSGIKYLSQQFKFFRCMWFLLASTKPIACKFSPTSTVLKVNFGKHWEELGEEKDWWGDWWVTNLVKPRQRRTWGLLEENWGFLSPEFQKKCVVSSFGNTWEPWCLRHVNKTKCTINILNSFIPVLDNTFHLQSSYNIS